MNQKLTLLYIDDEPINLLLFERVFKQKYQVLTAVSGQVGLDVLRMNPNIKAIISDMKMPGMNGIEFIKIIKHEYPDVACFILTGYSITEEISEAIDAHLVVRYFKKPFDIDEIEEALDQLR
jgi:two-component system, response regulator, stage 0 sporulation protein F